MPYYIIAGIAGIIRWAIRVGIVMLLLSYPYIMGPLIILDIIAYAFSKRNDWDADRAKALAAWAELKATWREAFR